MRLLTLLWRLLLRPAKRVRRVAAAEPSRVQLVGGPGDGEWATREHDGRIVWPHLAFDDDENLTGATICIYEERGGRAYFRGYKKSVRIG